MGYLGLYLLTISSCTAAPAKRSRLTLLAIMTSLAKFLYSRITAFRAGKINEFKFAFSLASIGRRIEDLKVLNSIIEFIFILVIDMLARKQLTPEMLLHKEPSVSHIPTLSSYLNVDNIPA